MPEMGYKNELTKEKNKNILLEIRHSYKLLIEITMLIALAYLISVVLNLTGHIKNMENITQEFNKSRYTNQFISAVYSGTMRNAKIYNNITVTCYNATESQCDAEPSINASGEYVRYGDIAVSRDLLREIPFGSVIIFDGFWYIVTDTLGEYRTEKINGEKVKIKQTRHVDILKRYWWDAAIWSSRKGDILVLKRGERVPLKE